MITGLKCNLTFEHFVCSVVVLDRRRLMVSQMAANLAVALNFQCGVELSMSEPRFGYTALHILPS